MDALADKQWNDWAQLLINRALDEHSEVMVNATVDYVKEQLKALREEIATLRADLTLYSGVARGEIADIRRKLSAA
jgi:hypothetical protein